MEEKEAVFWQKLDFTISQQLGSESSCTRNIGKVHFKCKCMRPTELWLAMMAPNFLMVSSMFTKDLLL